MAGTELRSGDPTAFGSYAIEARLGEGGQGTVYLGRDPAGERVAVKVLHPRFAADRVARARFEREIAVARQIAEFCTARVLDAGESGDHLYVVSEFIDGPSLQQAVERDGPRDGAALQRIAISTVTALVAIHQAGIAHRDFKPANVLLGSDGPRVIDFGISKALDATPGNTSGVVGTPTYMSPEQIHGEPAAAPSDVFSWAVTMVFAATGTPAFGRDTIPAVLHRILTAEPDLSGVPEGLRPLLGACLVKTPADRPVASDLLFRLIRQPSAGTATPSPLSGHPVGDQPSSRQPSRAERPPTSQPSPVREGESGQPPSAWGTGPRQPSGPPPSQQPLSRSSAEPPSEPSSPPSRNTAPPSMPPQPSPQPSYAGQPPTGPVPAPGQWRPSDPGGAWERSPGVTLPGRAGRSRPWWIGAAIAATAVAVSAGVFVLPPLLAGTGEEPVGPTPVALTGSPPVSGESPSPGESSVPPTASPSPSGSPSPAATPTSVTGDWKSAPVGGPLRGHRDDLQSVAIARVGGRSVIVSGANDRTVRLWDLATRKPLATLTGHTNWVRSVAVTELDGRTIAVSGGDDGTVRRWDLATRKPVGKAIKAGPVFSLALATLDGEPVVVTGGRDGSLRLWDLRTGAAIGKARRASDGAVFGLAVAELDGEPVVFTGGGDGTVRRWPLRSGPGETILTQRGQVTAVTTAELDGRLVVLSAGGAQDIHIDDAAGAGEARPPIRSHSGWVYSLAVGRVGSLTVVVSGSNDSTAQVHDLDTGKRAGRPFRAHDHNVFAAAVADLDGSPVAVTGGGDDTVRVWRLR
ncbi:WD40 repeat domain-containing serine/threonine protein kinase [Streptosporangium sp. NPDC002721]|uniref:WD40 repeat domain-containing serine/threonine protein kinase n=1 Tax=Streptosporangium sp. NPDC002721 TaxID=3366188 RepID=UPI0036CBB1FC